MSQNDFVQDGIHYVPSKVAAKRVGLSPGYISRSCRDGLVMATCHRGQWYVNDASLDAYLAKQAEHREENNRKLAEDARRDVERVRAASQASATPHPNLHEYTRTIAMHSLPSTIMSRQRTPLSCAISVRHATPHNRNSPTACFENRPTWSRPYASLHYATTAIARKLSQEVLARQKWHDKVYGRSG